MTSSRVLVTGTVMLALGCATSAPEMAEPAPVGPDPAPIIGSSPAAPVSMAPPTPAAPPPPPTCTMFLSPGVIQRAALVRLVDAGMARWLQGVDGDRVLAKHRFQGWVIKSLHPTDPCYREIDLRAGDVVQKVNGTSIEKPDQAFEVFESLRTARAIVIDYLRAGKPQQLTLAISNEK